MATIQSRLARLENRPTAGRPMMTRAKVEAINSAMADETFAALVDDLQLAVCRADTDPSLPHQANLSIPPDGPSIEQCERRLWARLAELSGSLVCRASASPAVVGENHSE